MRKIIHVDMDGFYTSVEQRDDGGRKRSTPTPNSESARSERARGVLRFFPVLADDRNFLGRRDVFNARPGSICIETKMVAEIALFRGKPITPAQGQKSNKVYVPFQIHAGSCVGTFCDRQ